MVVKSSSAIACVLVLVLVQSTQDLPCVSARYLLQFPGLGNFTNIFGLPPTIPAPTSPANAANGVASALTNAAAGLTNGVANAFGAPPANFSNPVSGLLNGIGNAANGVASALANTTSGVVSGLANTANGVASGLANTANGVRSGLTNAFGAPPAPSSRHSEEAPGTTITESFYISSTGLGSTLVTATTHIPPLNEIQIPDFSNLVSSLLPTKPSPKSPPSSSPSPPAASTFPGIPGIPGKP